MSKSLFKTAAPVRNWEAPGRGNLTSIPIFHASLLCGGLFERDVVLRGEGPQAARDDSNRAEFGPGRAHHIGGGGALLAQKSVLTVPTLQIVLCAGYGDLHCFPGQHTEPQNTGSHERSSSWGVSARLLTPPCSPSLGMPAEESWPPTSEPGKWQERLRCRTKSQAPREVNSQP